MTKHLVIIPISDNRFRWRAEMLLRERGIDSMDVEAKKDSCQQKNC